MLSEGCQGHRELDGAKMFEPFGCQKTNLTKPRVQLKFDVQILRVNCQGHRIFINGQKRGCPNYVFGLSEDTTFDIDGLEYRHERISISREAVHLDLPERLNLQLGISKVVIR